MPNVDHGQRQLHLKIVYYGPGFGGKTTNLEYLHRHSRADRRGKLISLVTESERTLFFDLLPMSLGSFRGYTVRLHLCTVPGQIVQDATRRTILRHVDGIVFVVDCQDGREEDNRQSAIELAQNLSQLGIDAAQLPMVVQYNKRDLDTSLPVADLREALAIPEDAEEVEASARYGGGVFETLKVISRACLRAIGDPGRAHPGRSPSILPGSDRRCSPRRFHRSCAFPRRVARRWSRSDASGDPPFAV
jgi:signal recognition particle receptor subunit beta